MGQGVQLHKCMSIEHGTVKLSRNVGQLNLRLLTSQKGEDFICTKAKPLTLNLPTKTIVAQPFNIIKWQVKFNPVA